MSGDKSVSDTIQEMLQTDFSSGLVLAKGYMASIGADNFWIGKKGGAINDDVPAGWHNYYLEQDFENIDPVLRAAYQVPSAHRWDAVIDRAVLTPAQKGFLCESESAGFHNGVSMPIAGPNGTLGYNVSVSGRTKDFDSGPNFRAIHAVTQVLMLSLPELMEHHPMSKVLLTPKEREAVQWAAAGKSYDEIKDQMNVSRSTVNKHIQSSMNKLGASNIVGLVAVALRVGEIDLDDFMG